MNTLRSFFLIILMVFSAAIYAGEYTVATYYFPGWKSKQVGAPATFPWDRIKSYPDREPILGWYDDGDLATVRQQMEWMHDYGIDYVIYDWYWTGKDKTQLTHSIDTYMDLKGDKPGFAIMWANHNETPVSIENFDLMIKYWADKYFKDKRYWLIDNKPVVFVFSATGLEKKASLLGVSPGELLSRANNIAKQYGYQGLYFVGGIGLERRIVREGADASGYSAFSTYNYHVGLELGSSSLKPLSSSYDELDRGYQYVWDWMVKFAHRPYFVPATAGWNKSPWGGSSDAGHDKSISTVNTFRSHLMSAKSYLDRYPHQTNRTVVICCWNEFGEGSYIEPTKSFGFQYLDAIKQVFRR